MITRRRKWLIAAAGLLLAGAALWCATRNTGKLEVKLFFVGWTNKVYPVDIGLVISPERLEGERTALILVTNTGKAAVMVHSAARVENFTDARNFAMADWDLPPTRLGPGKGLIVTALTEDYHQPWFTELLVRRAGWRDKTVHSLKDSTGNSYTSPPPGEWIRIGPITNQPPPLPTSNPAPASGGR